MSFQSALKSNVHFEINSKSKTTQLGMNKAYVYILASKSSVQRKKELQNILDQQTTFDSIDTEKPVIHFMSDLGPVWILQNNQESKVSSSDVFGCSLYAWFRDQSGGLISAFRNRKIEIVSLNFFEANEEIMRACLIGFEMGDYQFLNTYAGKKTTEIKFDLRNVSKSKSKQYQLDQSLIKNSHIEARSIIVARHLVNLPPNEANPQTIQQIVKSDLKFPKTVKITVWDHRKLKSENMNLHLAVGKGSETPPRMIHIKYRPAKRSSHKPIAFVGKGITFDTGGLDLKPSSAMRLMKKDMGGAAAVLALAYWVIHSKYERACDFYLALAENSVDAKSMRPSDVYKSRAGFLVEIDNTDAEGRLVLADVMDVAVKQKGADEPEILIDLATLTGAIKVALGSEVAGLFCNNDQLAKQLFDAGLQVGEPNWRMPLVQKYFSSMSSNFADFKNSGEGFGGAITAALFLEKFCANKKWAHLDIYSWNDKSTGALSFAGGSGQPVQSMIQWLKSQT